MPAGSRSELVPTIVPARVEWIVLCCFAGGEYNSGAVVAVVALFGGLVVLLVLGVSEVQRRRTRG